MANVLGKLFSDIATAIRDKTGDTSTMKPADFPAKISAIKVDREEKHYRIFSGSFTATSSTQIVDHNCGTVPDIIMVIPGHVPEDNSIISVIGYSTAMLKAFGGGYYSRVYWILGGGSM
jgi:hypothetical protein